RRASRGHDRRARTTGIEPVRLRRPGSGCMAHLELATSSEERLMLEIETNGVRLAVGVRGPEDGTPVVLLHGWPDRASLWDAQSAALSAAGFRTLAPDLRGFGDRGKPVGV